MSDYFDRGFSVREAMWHGKGTILADYPGREEAMQAAGHDFTIIELPVGVERQELILPATENLPAVTRARFAPAPGFRALARQDTGRVLYVARDSYTVVQNETAWDIADALANQPNVKYETGGVLKHGAVCWVLVWLDEPTKVFGDPSQLYPFAYVRWSHDGSSGVSCGSTSVRIVCWNTASAAELQARRTGNLYTFRHTASVMDRIQEARDVLQGVRGQFAEFVELANELAKQAVTEQQTERFIRDFIPSPAANIVSDRVVANIETARSAIRSILGSPTTEDIAGTKWGLFQAGVEYLDYIRQARTSDSKLNRSILAPSSLKSSLLTLVRSV